MKTSIGKIGRVTLKRAPALGIICRPPGTAAAEHLNSAMGEISRWANDMAGYAIVVWDSEMGYRSHFHTANSPIGGTTMPAFVHDALLRDWIERQR